MGHRPGIKGGYFPVPPVDSAQDMRSEYLKAMKDMGIKVEKHHHEVAPSQHELGMYFGTLVDQADNLQLYKYAVHMVSHSFGKTATFMPKPVKGDNGSGMHVHQSIWKGNTALFSGDKYAGLSDLAKSDKPAYLSPENNAVFPFQIDWCTCIPDPLSPFTGLGIKVAVFPNECETMCTAYLYNCKLSA